MLRTMFLSWGTGRGEGSIVCVPQVNCIIEREND